MDITRRKLLKLAGLGALGLTAGKYAKVFANNAFTETTLTEIGTGKRWAMVVDVRKCLVKEDCRDCINACHTTHNVPDIGNPKDEIKWIWKEDFENVFIDQENHYLNENLKAVSYTHLTLPTN